MGAEFFCVDRLTGMTKLTAIFRNFANTPKNAIVAHFNNLEDLNSLQ